MNLRVSYVVIPVVLFLIFANIMIIEPVYATPHISVQMSSGQTKNPLEINDTNGNNLFWVDSNGYIRLTNTGKAFFPSSGIVIKNPSVSFGTTIANSAQYQNNTVTIPLILGTSDTFGLLNTTQTWLQTQSFTGSTTNPPINIGGQLASAPSGATDGAIWFDNSALALKYRIGGATRTVVDQGITQTINGIKTFSGNDIFSGTDTFQNKVIFTSTISGGKLSYPAGIIVYANGTSFTERNSTNNILLTSSTFETVLQDALNRATNIYLPDATYVVSNNFKTFNMTSYDNLILDQNTVIGVPNGYAKALFTFGAGTLHSLIQGGTVTEAGTPQRHWTGIKFNTGTSAGIYDNKIRDIFIANADVGINFNGTTSSWANSNRIEDVYIGGAKRGIEFNFTGSFTNGTDGFNRNTFRNIVIECQNTCTTGINNIEHWGNQFDDVSVFDLPASAVPATVSSTASGTLISGGNLVQTGFSDSGTNTIIISDQLQQLRKPTIMDSSDTTKRLLLSLTGITTKHTVTQTIRNANLTYSYIGAFNGTTLFNNVTTSSASTVMSGSNFNITPRSSGEIMFFVTGSAENTLVNGQCRMDVRHNSSYMGAFGTTAGGTVIGLNEKMSSSTASANETMSRSYGYVGTVGQKDYIDIGINTGGTGTCVFRNWSIFAYEVG